LVTGTEDWSGGVKQKWTTVSWTQDDINLTYPKNPRVTGTDIYDIDNNHRSATISYGSYSLPTEVTEYDTDGSTILRRTATTYNLDPAYTDRCIIGLASAIEVSDATSLLSKTTFGYDETGLATPSAIQHDSASVTARGNLTTVKRWDATAPTDGNKAISQRLTGYNWTGSPVSVSDALGNQTTISYADDFSDLNNGRNTFAYPTIVTDPDTSKFKTRYNYDFGTVTRTEDPNGAIQTMSYDAAARILQVTNDFNSAYTRWVYGSAGYVSSYSTVNQVADEAYSLQLFDGAGRPYMTATNSPNSVGGYNAQSFRYDSMGRLVSQSNPTEVNWAWTPTGDDSAGWVWTNQSYDWKGRPLITTNADGSTRENIYGGCGPGIPIQGDLDNDFNGMSGNLMADRDKNVKPEDVWEPEMPMTWLVRDTTAFGVDGKTTSADHSVDLRITYREWLAIYFDALGLEKSGYEEAVAKRAFEGNKVPTFLTEFDEEIPGFSMLSRIRGPFHDAVFEADEVNALRQECLQVQPKTSNSMALEGMRKLLLICDRAQDLGLSVYLISNAS